ncbi:unnamed protein product [Pedinophyceae sp. YPF-701]|nr:unnamed protein product [Pedinophyceae sp. YPF-701]
MPVGGKLKLKGGEVVTANGVQKHKKKKRSKTVPEGEEVDPGTGEKKISGAAVDTREGKTYEQIFDLEMQRVKQERSRGATPWGSSYRAPPEILHGYKKKVKGLTASERLDLRCASKSDRTCK